MKKFIISVLSVMMLLTTAELTQTVPAHHAEAAVKYKNPIKKAGYNPYQWGSCAYYAYMRRAQLGRPVGQYWGNASNWAYNARRAGYTVKRKPVRGAVMQSSSGYYGHVAVVERINKNGSIMVSEMNFPYQGVKTYRTVPSSQKGYYNYIY